MKNQVSRGEAVNVITPSGGMVAGLLYIIGAMFGVASNTSLINEKNVIYTGGVFSLPKLSAQAWTAGQVVYWDTTNNWATTVAASWVKIGVATDIAANPSALGNVRLNPSF